MPQDRDPVERVVDAVRERVDRVREDVGHAQNGDFDRISEDTKRDLAESVRDSMEGRSRVDIPVNDRVTVQGRRERDGSVSVGIRVDLQLDKSYSLFLTDRVSLDYLGIKNFPILSQEV